MDELHRLLLALLEHPVSHTETGPQGEAPLTAGTGLYPLFQPIICLADGVTHGHEALIRGPSGGPLHAPQALFKTAERHGLAARLDLACLRVSLAAYARSGAKGRLFLNVSPLTLLPEDLDPQSLAREFEAMGIPARRIVLELTETTSPGYEYGLLRQRMESFRRVGFEIAMDDLGEGFSSLRLWSELMPSYVKVDKHFISGIHQDPDKLQFVRSIQQIAEHAGAHLVAEGVEYASELHVVKDLGIRYAQGYLIGRPLPTPAHQPAKEALDCLRAGKISVFPRTTGFRGRQVLAERLLVSAPCVAPETPTQEVLDLMTRHPEMDSIAVVEQGRPVGIIHRPVLFNRFIRLYSRELYGRRPCRLVMDPDPLVVDKATDLHELSDLVVRKGKQAFTSGFIITSDGRYLGMGSGFDLMRELTKMQIIAARHANPLTGLPGNVPIQEHLERLLGAEIPFVTAYADLNAFKAYNDVYGFRRGDDMIALLGRLLTSHTEPELDFVGHIGGDDFVVLFQSPDWQARCQRILEHFDALRIEFFSPEHVAAGGYVTENRRGVPEFHPLVSLAIGAVCVEPRVYASFHELAKVASEAKHVAKRAHGSFLFVDRRRPVGTKGTGGAHPLYMEPEPAAHR